MQLKFISFEGQSDIAQVLNRNSIDATLSSCISSSTPSSCSVQTLFLPQTQTTISDPTNRTIQKESFTQTFVPTIGNATLFPAEKLKWHSASGICLSREDGLLIPYSKSSSIHPDAYRYSTPIRPTPYPAYFFSNETVRFVRGRSILANCWRLSFNSISPSHYLFGMGKIFSHLVGLAAHGQPVPKIDNVILHQCQNPFTFDFGTITTKFFWEYGVDIGAFHNGTTLVVIPWDSNKRADAATYCVEKTQYNPNYGGYSLGANSDEVVKTFKERLLMHAQKNNRELVHHLSFSEKERPIRIKVFQRKSGTALRRLVNLREVFALLSEFTSDVGVISLDEATPFWNQVRKFNSFDILITPHGSHLTNGIFTLNKTAIIEIISSCREINLDFQNNLIPFGTHYTISTGHTPNSTNREGDIILEQCLAMRNYGCNDQAKLNETKECNLCMKESNIIVDIIVLRKHIEESLIALRLKKIK